MAASPTPSSPTLTLANRQRKWRPADPKRLPLFLTRLLSLTPLPSRLPPHALIAVTLVSPTTIAQVNEQFLGHHGATDVICFDYRAPGTAAAVGDGPLAELLVCPAVAAAAADRHGTTLSHEIVLYIVHGLLHLCGHDDHAAADRRAMRRAERRLLRRLAQHDDLDTLFQPSI